MTQRVITLFLFLCFTFIAKGQTPAIPQVSGLGNSTPGTLSATSVCAPGQTPFAGTFTQALSDESQSNSIMYLCFGDRIIFDHAGDFDLGGDPDPLSEPGIVYSLNECLPTITGPNLDSIIQMENCRFDNILLGDSTIFTTSNDNFTFDGNGFIDNVGGYQMVFNNGAPVEVFFAPITIDDFVLPAWESILMSSDRPGPCIHANTDDAFSITFLNEVQLLGLNNNAGGNGCTGTATVVGGLPEVDGTNYVIEIFLTSDPTVRGHSANNTNTTHDELFTFDVPAPGDYTIEVLDPNGCTSSFPVTMGSCQPVTLELGDSTAAPGSVFCIPITVQDYDDIFSLQFTVSWDNSIMTYNSIVGGAIPFSGISVGPAPNMITDFIRINAFDDQNFDTQTIPDGEIAFEICFDIIGPLGSSTSIIIEDNDDVEITGDISVPNNRVGYIFIDGSVLVTDGTLAINVSTICASTTNADEGEIDFSVIGGVAPYDYTYEQVGVPTNNGAGTLMAEAELAAIMDLPPGDYTITVTDASGLTTTTVVTVQETDNNFGAPPTAVPPTCATNTDGSVSIEIFGGVGPFTVDWSTGITNTNIASMDMINNLPTGTYSATITDANGCQTVASTSLNVSVVSVDTTFLQHVTCTGGPTDGAITVGASGGIGPYTFQWDDAGASTTASIDLLSPGRYCVTVNDANMCPNANCYEILAPVTPVIDSFTVDSIACPNDPIGSITVNVTPGNAPITNFAWNTGDSGATLNNLGPGVYIVTVTAQDGCTASDSVTLITPNEISIMPPLTTPPTCPGDSDGQIQLMISGATMPYSITWEDGSSVNPRFALACDSTYFVTITGANGCDTIERAIFLDCPPPIGVVFSEEMGVDCFNGDCNGQALATAFGGTSTAAVYNYQWENGESDMNSVDSRATQLCRGWNTVTINDNTCFIVDSVLIESPSEINIPSEDTNIQNTSCQGDSDGMITIAAAGGTPGYTYLWEDGTTGPVIGGLPEGPFSVSVTDANLCEEVFNIEINEPDLFEVLIDSAQLQQVLCSGDSSGVIVVFPTGGNAGIIDYQWTDSISTSSVGINLSAGSYSITATDPKGCTDDILVTLAEPDPIVFDIADIVEPQCFGFQTVVTIDTAFGGNGPLYEFSVNNGPKRPIQAAIPVLGGRSTLITVFDRSGCRAEEEITISQPAEIIVDLGDDIEIQLGESAELAPFIGSILPVDSIVWQPLVDLVCMDSTFCLDVTVAPLETQMYSLTIFDVNGCNGSDDILVEIDKNRNVFIPNAFSPNGDGNNDTFKPYIGPGVENINFMRVFDRWGEVLYSTDNLINKYLPSALDQSGWDGTLNGKRMNPGVYVYIMQVQFVDGQVLLYRGDVTLLY